MSKWRRVQMLCKDTVPKIRNKYSQKWNCAASFPIPIYIIPRSVHRGNIKNRSQIHKCGIWKKWDRPVSFLGIHKSDLLCSAWSKLHRRDWPSSDNWRWGWGGPACFDCSLTVMRGHPCVVNNVTEKDVFHVMIRHVKFGWEHSSSATTDDVFRLLSGATDGRTAHR